MLKKEKKDDKILEEIKRHNKILMEHMERQVKTVAEQHDSIKQDISEIKPDPGSVKSEVGTVKMAVMENSRQIKALKTGQERIEQKLDTTLTDHEQRIKKVEEKVGA